METKKIKALLTAVECGSLTAAAEQLGYTQSGMTHMMNALEEELGVPLLVRGKNGIRLSPGGQLLLPEMSTLLASADSLEHEANRIRERNFSGLHIGSHSSIVREWLPEILAEFRTHYPNVDESITMSSIPDLYSSLRSGELDCAVASYNAALILSMPWTPLRKDRFVAVVPHNFPFEGDTFPVSAFGDAPFLMPTSGFDVSVEKIFADSGCRLNENVKDSRLEDSTIVNMVAHGLGVTILTELIMQGMRLDNVRVIPIEPACYRELGIITSPVSQNDRNIRHFIQCAQVAIERMYSADYDC